MQGAGVAGVWAHQTHPAATWPALQERDLFLQGSWQLHITKAAWHREGACEALVTRSDPCLASTGHRMLYTMPQGGEL